MYNLWWVVFLTVNMKYEISDLLERRKSKLSKSSSNEGLRWLRDGWIMPDESRKDMINH